MKDAYPELIESAERVSRVVESEETRFARTLDLGFKKLEGVFGDARRMDLLEYRLFPQLMDSEVEGAIKNLQDELNDAHN